MRFTKYSKWTGQDWDSISLEDLLDRLADFLLQSGFRAYWRYTDDDLEQSLEALKEAIRQALLEEGLLSQEELQSLQDESGNLSNEKLEQLINRLIERLIEEGYLTLEEEPVTRAERQRPHRRGRAERERRVRIKFEITDKALDFLGYKTLKNLMASLGKSSFGRHDTKYLATGVEASEVSKHYEFGDTLNLDVNATLLNAIKREGPGAPVELDYPDLMVHQSEYQSSCATVLMLDCSHSMILYGEDRFTPAKRVALALTHLIRSQYPGDTLRLVLFHDSAEEVPLSSLARVQVGPYHTNTCEGLRLARRILMSQSKDMKQIIMITDGKPSAIFRSAAPSPYGDEIGAEADSGRVLYKNPFGLDPFIIHETLREVASCRKAGILINTFMVAQDYDLVNFVKKVTEIAQGKAYFTTTLNLGQYILMDYMKRKTSQVK